MYDIVGKKRWYFLFSALITVPGLIFILLGGLRPTIDFTGGTVWEARLRYDSGSGMVEHLMESPSRTVKDGSTRAPPLDISSE